MKTIRFDKYDYLYSCSGNDKIGSEHEDHSGEYTLVDPVRRLVELVKAVKTGTFEIYCDDITLADGKKINWFDYRKQALNELEAE